MKVRVLGPLEIESESGELVRLGPPKQRALLALLAINPNSVVSTDRIIDALWGEDQQSSRLRSVRVYIARLRDVLEPDRQKRAAGRLLVTEPSGYALRIDPEDIDSVRFERLIGQARAALRNQPGAAIATIQEALALWRDHPLAGLEYEEFAQAEIRRLEELHVQAQELRHEAAILMGDSEEAIPALEKLIVLHPLREGLVASLMRALTETGRQSEALRAYRALALRLADATGLEPSAELQQLEERILLQTSPVAIGAAPVSEGQPRSHLPARLTSLVGRADETKAIAALLSSSRLVTLTGPGGVGKTSLGIEAARAAINEFPGGQWLTDLALLGDASRLTATVADALDLANEPGIALERSIASTLDRDRSLLVLDNCEHLADAVGAFCTQLLRDSPRTTVLCTSRRSLTVEGETVFEVTPLSLPPPEASVEDLRASPAARLLEERAVAAAPSFEITPENAPDVASLCRRLDGIPLAIELAASNLRSMTVAEISGSLSDRLSLGARGRLVPRHQTLRATLQWSYDLLGEREQDLFDWLSVFASSFSRSAALALGARLSDEVPDAELAALVESSMLIADTSGEAAAYRMLPTVRDFGTFNLRERGEFQEARRAHAEYLNALADTVDLPVALTGGTKSIAANVAFADFAVAADWAIQTGQVDLAIGLLVALGYHWINGGRLDEASHWLSRVHELGEGKDSLNGWKLRLVGAQLDWFTGSNERAEDAFRSLSAEAAEMGEPYAAADARQFAGYVRWRTDLRGARDDMAAAARTGTDQPGRSMPALEALAILELYLGDVAQADVHTRKLEAWAEESADPVAKCNALNARGWLACYTGKPEESVASFEQCRDTAAAQGDWHHEVNARLGLAWVFPTLGRPHAALDAARQARDLAIHAANAGKLAEALLLMGWAYLDLGDQSSAAGLVREGLTILRDGVDRIDHMSRGLRIAGWIALAAGDIVLAVRFISAAQAEHDRIGFVDPPADAALTEGALLRAAEVLTAEEWESATASRVPFPGVIEEAIEYLVSLEGEGPA